VGEVATGLYLGLSPSYPAAAHLYVRGNKRLAGSIFGTARQRKGSLVKESIWLWAVCWLTDTTLNNKLCAGAGDK